MNPSRKTFPRVLAAGLALAAMAAYGQDTVSEQKYSPPPPAPERAGTPLSTTPPESSSTPAKAREFTVAEFLAVDTDYDGRISLEEFTGSPILSGKAEAKPEASGTPRSDEATQAHPELKGRNTPELFRRLDKNENGYLNSTEMAAYYEVDTTL